MSLRANTLQLEQYLLSALSLRDRRRAERMAEEARQARFRRQPLSEATGGRGVDVVLNSLTGQAIIQGLKCLAPFGRFIELGKTDVYGNAALGLKPLGEGASKNMPSFDDKYQRHTGVPDTLR